MKTIILCAAVAFMFTISLPPKISGALSRYARPRQNNFWLHMNTILSRQMLQMNKIWSREIGELKKELRTQAKCRTRTKGQHPSGTTQCKPAGRDCAELYNQGIKESGIYRIKPFQSGVNKQKSVSVYCDMKTDGGGWTVFQRRIDGAVSFDRKWAAYRAGFGNTKTDYWLGLDAIHELTLHRPSKLRVDLQRWSGTKIHANYGVFSIGDMTSKYKLRAERYSGTAGDALRFHNGMKFSTKDQDNDTHKKVNCAAIYKGGWWFFSCHRSNLNGRYYYSDTKVTAVGVNWYDWKKKWFSFMKSEMKVRPRVFKH